MDVLKVKVNGQWVGIPSIRGEKGSQGDPGTPGQDGQDGQSAYVYIRYAANQPTSDSDMKTEPDAWMGMCSGRSSTAPTHYTDYAWYKIKGETGAAGQVQDVQVNGTSVLLNGVANIPVASANDYGVAKPGLGLKIYNNSLAIDRADASLVKAGINENRPIVPFNQHSAVFYALAKLAGVDLASVQNVTVGQWPDNALVAIQKMLGVYETPWEIINEETFTNAEEADKIITTDQYGQPFELIEVMMLFELPKLATGDVDSSKGQYGQIHFIYDNGEKTIAPEPGAFSRTADGDAKGAWYYIQNNKGLIVTEATTGISNTNSGGMRMRYNSGATGGLYSSMGCFIADSAFAITSINIKKVTGNGRYRLYGRRKPT